MIKHDVYNGRDRYSFVYFDKYIHFLLVIIVALLFIVICCSLKIVFSPNEESSPVLEYTKIVLCACSILCALLSILTTVLVSMKNIRNTALLSANIKLCDTESTIAKNKNLLRFHIEDDPQVWLSRYDLTPEEFSYLLASFSLSSALYTTSPCGHRLVEKNSYRDMMFKTSSMQKAWPAIRMFLANKDFVKDMDILYNSHLK